MPRLITKLFPLLGLLSCGVGVQAAEETGHGVEPIAHTLFHVGPLPVTNSMLTSWVVALVLIALIRLAIRKPQLVPTRGQAVVENIVESIRDLIQPIVGKKASNAAFPLLVALFVFILIQNWSGLVPGVGTIYKAEPDGQWAELVRPGNADLNATLGLAVVAMIGWLYLILRYAGPKAIFLDIFGNKADKHETPAVIYYPLFVIFFLVGILEIVSIGFRPVSLSFRLFGNVFGGENLIHAMSGMQKWLLPVPFYFLEVLIGFVQAFVFTLLVAVYIGLICNHGDDHDHDHAGHGHAPGAH